MIKKWQRSEGEGGKGRNGRVEGRCRRQYRISRWNDTTINCRAHTCRHHSFANGIKKEKRGKTDQNADYIENTEMEKVGSEKREKEEKRKKLASFIARIKGSVRVIGLSRVIRTMYIFSENQTRTLLRSLHTHIRARAHIHAHILAANPLNEHYVELYQ